MTVTLAGLVALALLMAVAVRPQRTRLPDRRTGLHARDGVQSVLCRWTRRLQRLRRTTAGPAAIADWCEELSRRVRAGASLRDALTAALSADPAWRRQTAGLRHALERGAPTDAAIARVTAGPGAGADAELVVTVLGVAARLGGSPAVAIDRTAAALRQRDADVHERDVQAAQARLSAHVLTVLPIAILGVLLVADTDVRAVVVTPVGAACITIGLALNAVGWWWMRRVVGR